MRLSILSVQGHGKRGRELESALVEEYLRRASLYLPASWETFATEEALLRAVVRESGRLPATLVLMDGRGRQMGSEQFSTLMQGWRDGGQQRVLFAVGPADGWSDAARKRADLLLSLGLMTLPHALAQVLLAEQIYRALTILAGHPYHSGH